MPRLTIFHNIMFKYILRILFYSSDILSRVKRHFNISPLYLCNNANEYCQKIEQQSSIWKRLNIHIEKKISI